MGDAADGRAGLLPLAAGGPLVALAGAVAERRCRGSAGQRRAADGAYRDARRVAEDSPKD